MTPPTTTPTNPEPTSPEPTYPEPTTTGRLWGVGVGPGDPELVTVKAARLIAAADVVAYHSARHGRSVARAVAAPYLRAEQVEEALYYPVTTETTDHPGGYRGAIEDFYTSCAARLAAHLDAGRDVVVLSEGDPFFYGSYMHMHRRLAHRYPTEVVPGVTSLAAAAAALGRPLVEGNEVLTVLPGTMPADQLAARLASTDSAAVIKLGRTFGGVRDALASSGRLAEAWYVERATHPTQRTEPLAEVDPATVPYFSVAVLPSPDRRVDPPVPPSLAAGNQHQNRKQRQNLGEVVVVGLGPAGRDWLTPQAALELAAADDLVGYGPYLARVPPNPRQRRHSSGNTVESERAEHALELALTGARVAVVSSGDPGVFAMATAVVEAAEQARFTHVPVRVAPGLTAAHAVASRVGAQLGHDYCVVSLSDRLKPWDVVESRLRAAAGADLVLALYNPASKSRTWQVAKARDVLLDYRAPTTPVVVGRDVGGPTERVTVVTLADLDPAEVDMRTLLLVGSSTTRLVERAAGTADGHSTTMVFTPRRYS